MLLCILVTSLERHVKSFSEDAYMRAQCLVRRRGWLQPDCVTPHRVLKLFSAVLYSQQQGWVLVPHLRVFHHLFGLWWNFRGVWPPSEHEHLFLCWLATGASFSVTWLFRVVPYFWFGLFLLLICKDSILGTFISLIQLELVLFECWEVRINFCLSYLFSVFYCQHSWHIIFLFCFVLFFASKYNYISGLGLYSKLSVFFKKNYYISDNYGIIRNVIMV